MDTAAWKYAFDERLRSDGEPACLLTGAASCPSTFVDAGVAADTAGQTHELMQWRKTQDHSATTSGSSLH